MSDEPSPLKDAIMDAVYTPLERDDMQTPCTLPFMTSSEHGVCDGDGCPVSDETIASALNAVAKIQAEYHKVKKGTQKETKKETKKGMTNEPSPRPWQVIKMIGLCEDDVCVYVADARNSSIALMVAPAENDAENARLIVDAVNERDRLNEDIESWRRGYIKARTERNAFLGQRDRLRDIVRRLADMAENLLANYECRYREDRNSMAFVENARNFIREARAALGEACEVVEAVNERARLRADLRSLADEFDGYAEEDGIRAPAYASLFRSVAERLRGMVEARPAAAPLGRQATEEEVDGGKAKWCQECVAKCPLAGRDALAYLLDSGYLVRVEPEGRKGAWYAAASENEEQL